MTDARRRELPVSASALSPADPVLASDVQVEHEHDRDRLRFSLTAEAGLNDGTSATPVMRLYRRSCRAPPAHR